MWHMASGALQVYLEVFVKLSYINSLSEMEVTDAFCIFGITLFMRSIVYEPLVWKYCNHEY